jgi:uncharacterized repeat protein (TIGR03837 family)
MVPLAWDVFCRVVDNFGDIGVCWRLAADLATRGQRVRLWASDASALAWMAPRGQQGVEVRGWDDAQRADAGDVVIEAFGCDPPAPFVQRMAARMGSQRAPVWVNLEYLSAEPQARRNHGLRSPQLAGPGRGLDKWFFYPGFEAGTGGLIREADLAARQARFDSHAWLAARGLQREPGERCVSLFCYDGSPVPALIDALADEPTLLLATAGGAAQQVQAALGPRARRGALRALTLPWLSQADYDHLLWSCDLNFVRGEDSWVRAQWAGRPFVWQAYRQDDAAHLAKLDAYLTLYLRNAHAGLAAEVRHLWQRWNGAGAGEFALPASAPWAAHQLAWRKALMDQTDLGTQLLGFVRERR